MVLEFFLAGCVIGLSSLLFATSLVSYSRLRHTRFVYVALAFLLFLVQGILIMAGLLVESLKGSFSVSNELLAVDLLILLFLYLAVAKR